MAASRLDMFWAEATDVDAATESPTKSARESLFAYLMNSAPSGYVDLTPYIIFWFLAQRQCLAPKHLSRFMSTCPNDPNPPRPTRRHRCAVPGNGGGARARLRYHSHATLNGKRCKSLPQTYPDDKEQK